MHFSHCNPINIKVLFIQIIAVAQTQRFPPIFTTGTKKREHFIGDDGINILLHSNTRLFRFKPFAKSEADGMRKDSIN